MAYVRSSIDEKNFLWFEKDHSRQTLVRIELRTGQIRSLRPFAIEFSYPLSAIAGRNGSGKSTMLAVAACAFHNGTKGYRLPDRKATYYTFADFFIQADDDIPLGGIEIHYSIRHDKWRHPETGLPDARLGLQRRTKGKGGRWNDYAARVRRNVIYMGINRVVPHSEKTVSKSYRSNFSESEARGFEDEVRADVGDVLGIQYDAFKFRSYAKYRLPSVKARSCTYTGFNMGAGENALFEMFSHIHACPSGTLILVDEIELGLHEEAQRRLVHKLKSIAKDKGLQFLFTTHSPTILKNLPPEARFFIENLVTRTEVVPKISAEFAAGKMSGVNSRELTVLVEDVIAKATVEASLSAEQRARVSVYNVGSAEAVVRHLASKRREKADSCLAVLDGDQKVRHAELEKTYKAALQSHTKTDVDWFLERCSFLPGETWPEKWLIKSLLDDCASDFKSEYGFETIAAGKLCLNSAIDAGKHAEFLSLSEKLFLPRETIISAVPRLLARASPSTLAPVRKVIQSALER